MGDRVTRVPQSRELVRAKRLRQALEHGAPPTFVPPAVPNPVAQPFSLSWSSAEKSSLEKNPAESSGKANSKEKNPRKISSDEVLNTRRQYLEQLFQNSPDPLVIVDASFRGQCVNQEFQRLFGHSAAQVLGKPVNQLIFPPDRAAEAEWIMQCLERGEHITLETQRLAKDGTLLDVSVSSAPLIIDGQTVAFYAIYRDISERKRAEALSSALYRIAEKASAAQDLQQFFAAVHGIVDELMPARNFSIAIHDPESQLVGFPYFVDEQESAPAPGKPSSGLIEYVLRTGEPLLCTPELAQQMQKRGEVALTRKPPLYWLGVPLKINHRILGALVLKSYSKNSQFRDRDQDVLTLISQQLPPLFGS